MAKQLVTLSFPETLSAQNSAKVPTGNMKRTWVHEGQHLDWWDPAMEGGVFLREAVQWKNIWVPYGA